MSLDREQIRNRPVLDLSGRIEGVPESGILITVEERDALLAELEQAEREQDRLRGLMDMDVETVAAEREAAESRLAKVPALVEAAQKLIDRELVKGLSAWGHYQESASLHAALKDWAAE